MFLEWYGHSVATVAACENVIETHYTDSGSGEIPSVRRSDPVLYIDSTQEVAPSSIGDLEGKGIFANFTPLGVESNLFRSDVVYLVCSCGGNGCKLIKG